MLKEIIYNFLIRVKTIIYHKLEIFLSDVIVKYGFNKAVADHLKLVEFARFFISHVEEITDFFVYLFFKNIQKIHIIALFFLTSIYNKWFNTPTADIGGIELDQAGKVVEELVKLVPQEDMDQLAKKCQELFEQQEEPLKQEPPADTRGGFLIFCASAGLFIAVRLYFG